MTQFTRHFEYIPPAERTNRSCAWIGKQSLQVQNSPLPAALQDDEVLIQIIATGLCGSDCNSWNDDTSSKQLIFGHELAGWVVEIGSGVTNRSVGQRVAIEPRFACHVCEYCLGGRPHLCVNLRYCSLDPTDGTLLLILESVSWKEAGCIQPLAVAVQLARRAETKPGQTVALFGCGPLGLLIMAVAKARGVKTIIAFDIEQSRVHFASSYAADKAFLTPRVAPTTLALTTSYVHGVLKDCGIPLGVDLAIEASGAETRMQMAVITVKPCGTVIQAGLGDSLSSIPMRLVTTKELDVKGTVRYTPGCFAEAIDLIIASKKVNVEPLFTSLYPLTESSAAFRAQHERKGIKIVIVNQA